MKKINKTKTILTISYDEWRHRRMHEMIRALLNPDDSWLTVGDGKGTDAQYLSKSGIKKIVSSDINGVNQNVDEKLNGVNFYKKSENAEKLSFLDETFDYVFCKESFHHFSKPITGLYELIRVAKQGIVLIEPNDIKAFFPHRYINQFETVGNYVYRVSLREIEKIAHTNGFPYIAQKGIDDIYLEKEAGLPENSFNVHILVAKIFLHILDFCEKIGIRSKSLICVVIFKSNPRKHLLAKLKNCGFTVIKIAENPYKRKQLICR